MRIAFLLSLLILFGLGMGDCAIQDMELSNEGFQQISKRNYGQAETSLEKALSINPENPYAFFSDLRVC